MAAAHLVLLAVVAMAFSQMAIATDPTQLQDFCVADNTSQGINYGLIITLLFACSSPLLI
jgi:hypothetical protein